MAVCRTHWWLPAVLLCAAATRLDPPPGRLDFDSDILPVLEKQGCASAYCHGSAKGKGGLKLSLFASDPDADYRAIVEDLDGRRVDLARPERSLILRKPSRQLPHAGGRKLAKGSPFYERLRSWIAAGAPRGVGRKLATLRIVQGKSGLQVRGRFAGGQAERPLTLAMFTSTDETVATVDRRGRVTWHKPGEVWVTARYLGHHARIRLTRSFAAAPVASRAAVSPLDRVWLLGLSRLGLQPLPRQPDGQLVRRLFLDLLDRPPTPRELQRFLRQPDVAATASRLVDRPEFLQKWGRLLAEWLEVPAADKAGRDPRRQQNLQLRQDLVASLRQSADLRTLARKLLTKDRRLLTRRVDPRDRAEFVGRAFLGMRLGCARCHNHPLDRWRQSEHLAFAAWFADPRPDGRGGREPGVLFHPVRGTAVVPSLLPLGTAQPSAQASHAETVADFVLHQSHGQFARNIVNRVFAEMMGEGLVEPVDDHRLSNPSRSEDLLQALAASFADGDLRRLCVRIATTGFYQAGIGMDPQRVRYLAARQAVPLSSSAFRRSVQGVLGVTSESIPPLPESPLARQLALLNGPFLHAALQRQDNNLAAILAMVPKPERLRAVYRLLLSRDPRPQEQGKFAGLLAADVGLAKNARDLAFALLCSREFGSKR